MPVLERKVVSTQPNWTFSMASASDTVSFAVGSIGQIQTGKRADEVREAVLTHIEALRALGKTRANTRDIASALDLPRVVVEQAVRQLGDKGVKIAR